jgi:competence protein ComEA
VKQFLKEFLSYNKKERRGVYVLLTIIVLLLLFLTFYEDFLPEEKTDFTAFQKEIASFDSLKGVDSSSSFNPVKTEKSYTQLFPFDPNDLSEDKWKMLGLSEKQIRVIKNYESKGGKFYKKEDLKKIYGISLRQYEGLEPYIVIPPKPEQRKEEIKTALVPQNKKVVDLIIEINRADSELLVSLNGIGPAFANRILKYRNSLGGFVKKEQLLEVYGLTRETFDKISSRVTVDPQNISRININTVELKDLRKHPYIKYNIANAIMSYRKAHGNYKSIEDLKKIDLVDQELFDKISAYLEVK